jgi:uncharacterized membrane protein
VHGYGTFMEALSARPGMRVAFDTGGWLLSVVVTLLLLGLVVALIAWLIRTQGGAAPPPSSGGAGESARNLLGRRLASGEIDEDDCTRLRSAFSETSSPSQRVDQAVPWSVADHRPHRGARLVGLLAGAPLVGAMLWWRRHPSACPYSQRFWLEPPHPLITRARLHDILEPQLGERILEIGPRTGY